MIRLLDLHKLILYRMFISLGKALTALQNVSLKGDVQLSLGGASEEDDQAAHIALSGLGVLPTFG